MVDGGGSGGGGVLGDGLVAHGADAVGQLGDGLGLAVHGGLAGGVLAGLLQRAADPESLDLAVNG